MKTIWYITTRLIYFTFGMITGLFIFSGISFCMFACLSGFHVVVILIIAVIDFVDRMILEDSMFIKYRKRIYGRL